MKTEMNHCDFETETVFRFDPVDKRWHGWTRNTTLARKLIGNQWEIIGVDDNGTSFIAPKHALQICPTGEKKLDTKEYRELISRMCRVHVNATIEVRHKKANKQRSGVDYGKH